MTIQLSPLVYVYETEASPFSASENKIALQQIPSSAFGDGSHPTTRLCAGAVDFLCRQQAPDKFLDVGTGTGILARIGRARGAKFVVGTDIDPAALSAAKQNADLDHHSIEVEISAAMPDQWGAVFNLIVANILEGPLLKLAPFLSNALAPGGQLLISGFTRLQLHALINGFEKQGLTFVSDSHLDEWAMLMFRKAN